MNPHIFRKYDIRGVVGQDLTADSVRRIGQAFAIMARLRTSSPTPSAPLTVVVGHDCRVSSPELADALAQGLEMAGVRVIEVGMVPSPVLYFMTHTTKADGGIVLTGSHNPPEYNGLKMLMHGEAIYGEAITALYRAVTDGDMETFDGGSRERRDDAVSSYQDWVQRHAQMGSRRLKVVVDAGNGVSGPTALPLLEALGIDVIPLFCEPDGTFPNHHPDPTVEANLTDLRREVLATGADFGVGFDGDGDRIGVLDERGEVIWGDRLMIIFSRALLKASPGATIVGEVKCSQTLFDDIEAHGGHPIMWKVGHSLIKAKMKEESALLAGEMSGHIFFKHRFFGFDDATYSATRLAEIVSSADRPLSSYLDGVPKTYATPEIRVDTGDDAHKFVAAEAVATSYEMGRDGVRDLVTLDGVRVIFEDGWGLVRASNTQPVLVVRAEANSPERRDAILADLKTRIHAALEG